MHYLQWKPRPQNNHTVDYVFITDKFLTIEPILLVEKKKFNLQ